jgi:hypothetical protein
MTNTILLCLAILFPATIALAAEDQPSHAHEGHSMTMPMAKDKVMKMEEDNSSVHRSAGPTKDKMHMPVIRNGEAMEAMPMIKPKRIYTVTGKEDFEAIMGYGRQESMVAMMNLMMVEGSDMEGMEMEPMTMAVNNDDPLDPKNIEKYKKGVKVEADQAMHAGHPMKMPMAQEKALSVKAEVQPNPPIVGENRIIFSVSAPGSGQRIADAKLKAKVEMTSMDMGSEEPEVKRLPDGGYEVKVRFTMKGPWRVHVEGTAPGQPEGSISSDLLFEAGSKTPWVQHD